MMTQPSCRTMRTDDVSNQPTLRCAALRCAALHCTALELRAGLLSSVGTGCPRCRNRAALLLAPSRARPGIFSVHEGGQWRSRVILER